MLLGLLAGCADETLPAFDESANEGMPGTLMLELIIPELIKKEIRTRATGSEEGEIRQMDVVVFSAEGEFLEKVQAKEADIKENADGSRTVALKVKQQTKCTIYMYANAGTLVSDKEIVSESDLTKIEIGGSSSEPASPFVLGGKIANASITSSSRLAVTLCWNVAKISVMNKAEGFSLQGLALYDVPDKGVLTTDCATITVPSDAQYTNRYVHEDVTLPFYTYERSNSESGMAYLVLEALYKGVPSFYRVDFRDAGGSLLHLQRTHHYTVRILKVEGSGYVSADEAAKYPASNIVVEIIDENPTIMNIVTNGQYELGLCDTLHINAIEGASSTATVVLKAADHHPLPDDLLITGESKSEWLTVGSLSTGNGIYSCVLTAKSANYTGEPRIGQIVFSVGNLSNTLVVVQDAADLISVREVKILEKGGGETSYSSFLNDIQGLSKYRNNGLHFSMFNNIYSYVIPFDESDVSKIQSCTESPGGMLDVTVVGSKVVVALKTASLSSAPFVCNLKVTLLLNDGNTRTETYPVYKTGIFAVENGEYQVSSQPVTGKLYYEVVQVDENYWLDRNVGATSNGFWSNSTNTHEGQDRAAIGGYYKIKETTTEAVLSVCPAGFTVPSQAQFTKVYTDKRLQVKHTYTNAGNGYWLPILTSTQANAPLKEVCFPMGGYMQSDEVKGNGGGYYWTSTFAYDGQVVSYDRLDPEQKYWQRRLNMLTNQPQFLSDRFVSGSNGGNDEAYKGMSIRCVRNGM